MRDRSAASFVALLLALASLTPLCASAEEAEAPRRYSSPTAVFDAYRDARGKQEWRRVFACLTPDGQKDAIFEARFACGMHESKEELAVLKKYGVDAALEKTLKDEYRAKHGGDPDDAALDKFLNEGYGAGASKLTNAESDKVGRVSRGVMCNILAAHVKDQAGFFADVASLPRTKPPAPLGELEQVTVENNAATGRAKLTIVPSRGESRPVTDKIDRTFRFRRIDGGWLLDSL